MNGISRIQTTNANPAFKANYKMFKLKLAFKRITTGPLLPPTQKINDRLAGKRHAEIMLCNGASQEDLANTIKGIWKNGDYYFLEGFNKKLGNLAEEVYKLI